MNVVKHTIGELPGVKKAFLSGVKLRGQKFSYALDRNISKIDSAMQSARSKIAKHAGLDLINYMEEKEILDFDFCKKNENGEPIFTSKGELDVFKYKVENNEVVKDENGNPIILDNGEFHPDYNHKLYEIKSKCKNVDERLSKHIEWMEKFLKEEVEIEYFLVEEENLPIDINLSERRNLKNMIAQHE